METIELHQVMVKTRNFGWYPSIWGIGKWQITDIEWYSGPMEWVSILCLN